MIIVDFVPASRCRRYPFASRGVTRVSSERSEALVLRSVDYSETSRIVTFLSPVRGKLACMAAGARRAKSKLAGVLDTFSRVEAIYTWKDGRSVQRLTEASLLDGHFGIKRDLDKSLYGAVPLEAVYKVAHENEPSQELYDALCDGLKQFDAWPGDIRTHACWQLMRVLASAGFELNLERLLAERGRGAFSYRTGMADAGEPYDRRLARPAFEALCTLAEAQEACPPMVIEADVFNAVSRYAEHQLESTFKSLRVLQEMANGVSRQI